jgi:hypothetical protein
VCVCVFSVKSAFPLFLESLAPHAGGLKRCSRDCSGVLVVASLEETRGLLSRFDCVYSDYITQGCPGGALAVAMSLRARCAFFPTHVEAAFDKLLSKSLPVSVTGHVRLPRLLSLC